MTLPRVPRRSVLLAPLTPLAANAVEQPMKTSSDFQSYEAVTGESRGANLGAGSISGKSRPVTGCTLVEAPTSAGGTVSAELVLSGGVLAKVAFDAPALKLAKGFYYDVEARDKLGDSSYVHVIPAASGQDLSPSYLASQILRTDGRYGAFGPPTDVKATAAAGAGSSQLVDVAFSAITPGGSLTPRRAVLAAATAPGSSDVLVLVSSASESRWNAGGEAAARAVSKTFRVAGTRPTKLKADRSSDYRFEEQGGLRLPANPLDGFSTEPAFG
eukprot:CAMPEP_0119269054 /NCGR_PEP_ID=MMETSP1329-20130426/6605_1 /TAXON_ID=114041 /ORGANISM="Genus nov. species nov., Strain RCC1024" /LENGTH=271 /DNA_ID=CAMNT_0007269041 /DNA_START=317 /DNA_END=1128 /DNA_ORIENTATION=-